MQRVLRAFVLALAIALLGASCGEDAQTPKPIDEAEPGDVTDAGIEGAFGEVDHCAELGEEAAASYARVVEQLGDAGRDDVDRIDVALESFGGIGPDLQVRADGLDCTPEDLDGAVCRAVSDLEPGGVAAEDFLAGVLGRCSAPA